MLSKNFQEDCGGATTTRLYFDIGKAFTALKRRLMARVTMQTCKEKDDKNESAYCSKEVLRQITNDQNTSRIEITERPPNVNNIRIN